MPERPAGASCAGPTLQWQSLSDREEDKQYQDVMRAVLGC